MLSDEAAAGGMEVPKNKLFEGGQEGSTPPGLWSDTSFSSVVDSSTETDGSEEDDEFMAGLAERMAHSMLDDSDDNNGTGTKNEVDGSGDSRTASLWAESWNPMLPQTKSDADQLKTGWSANCWNNTGYNSSSSKVSSQVSSPPSTPGALDDGWDLLHAVAGEVKRLDTDDNKASPVWRGQTSHHLPEVQWKHASLHDSPLSRSSGAGTLPILTKPYAAVVNPQTTWREEDHKHFPQQPRAKPSNVNAWHRPQARAHPHPQPQPQVHPHTQHQQQHGSLPRSTYRCGMAHRPLAQHHWPALAQANGSGMRAVFLGGASDRSSSGTGVFLPRSSSDYSTKRKTSCSSVLLPSRIVQVLNLNIEDMRCQPSPHSSGSNCSSSSSSSGSRSPGSGPPMPPIGAEAANRLSNPPPAEEQWPSSQWKTYSTCSQLHQPSEPTLPTEWSY